MTGDDPRPGSRHYRSELRASRAAETRSRILDAAARLFATAGYAGTSTADIAQAAGVSLETVKAVGPKRQLLLGAFEHRFVGAEGVGSLADHAPVSEITAEVDDVRYLAGIVHFVAESNRRSSLLWSALLAAAASDAALGAELTELQDRRHRDMLILVDELRRRQLVSGATSRERLADAISFLLSPEGYNQLVIGAHWKQADYEAWLGRSIAILAGDAPESE